MTLAAGAARVLVVAGHDSSLGAGVDADREAIEHFGGQAVPVVTARTVQSQGRVLDVGARPASAWLAEATSAIHAQQAPLALKTGLLCGVEHVASAAALVRRFRAARGRERPVVVDPVLAASGGERFLEGAGVAALLAELLPLDVVVTPNLPELARLAGASLETLAGDGAAARDARVRAATILLARGARAVVAKGGHGTEDPVRDLCLERSGAPRWLEHPRVRGGSLHGSGCRFASALAALLARGSALDEAARRAGLWLGERIAEPRGRAGR